LSFVLLRIVVTFWNSLANLVKATIKVQLILPFVEKYIIKYLAHMGMSQM
jgi:hypothetical protein